MRTRSSSSDIGVVDLTIWPTRRQASIQMGKIRLARVKLNDVDIFLNSESLSRNALTEEKREYWFIAIYVCMKLAVCQLPSGLERLRVAIPPDQRITSRWFSSAMR